MLYNGKKKWTIPFNIKDLIQDSIPEKYIPSFSYYPVLENQISEKVLVKIRGLVASVILLEQQKNEKKMREKIDLILSLIEEEQPEQLRMFAEWVNQVFKGALDKDDIAKIHELTEVKSMLAEIADKIEERGVRKGRSEGRQEAARKMLQKGFSIEDIADITGLTKEIIESLKQK